MIIFLLAKLLCNDHIFAGNFAMQWSYICWQFCYAMIIYLLAKLLWSYICWQNCYAMIIYLLAKLLCNDHNYICSAKLLCNDYIFALQNCYAMLIYLLCKIAMQWSYICSAKLKLWFICKPVPIHSSKIKYFFQLKGSNISLFLHENIRGPSTEYPQNMCLWRKIIPELSPNTP